MATYERLAKGEIRVLKILNTADTDSDGTIRCALRHVQLEEVSACNETIDADALQHGHVWAELRGSQYNYAALFSNKSCDSTIKQYRRTQLQSFHRHRESVQWVPQRADLSKRYLALSYVWGLCTSGKHVFINGCPHAVTDNLFAALERLQKSAAVHDGLEIWADAICINQHDLGERAEQVQLMQPIYAGAWQVAIWLGPSNEHTELAFTAVRWLAEKRYDEASAPRYKTGIGITLPHLFGFWELHRQADTLPLRNEVKLSLWSLFSLPYWQRLWILQEAASAKSNAPILWGSFSVSFEELRAAASYIEKNERWLGRGITCAVGNGQPLQLVPQNFTRDRDLNDQDATPARLWKLTLRVLSLSSNESRLGHSHIDAFDTLDLIRNAGASEQRDKVFAILGLPTVAPLVQLRPDYQRALAEMYRMFSRELFRHSDLNALRLVQTPLGDLSKDWLFRHEPLTLSKRLRLACYNPLWPPETFTNNVRVLIHSVAGQRPPTSAIAPCTHQLPSWTICLSCRSAPTAALPTHYQADLGLHEVVCAAPTLSPDILHVQGVFIDAIASLSSFHARELDLSYPTETKDREVKNAYAGKAGLQDALWRTLVADTLFDESPVSTDCRKILLSSSTWTHSAQDRLIGMSQIQFGLPYFFRRNKSLSICGFKFSELLIESRSPHLTARAVPKTELEIQDFEVVSRAANLLAWRRLIATQSGRIGLATAASKLGDQIVVLKGCGTPMVLRPCDGNFTVVGECYVHGIMNGMVAQMVLAGNAKVTTINLQ